jgi:hypothetical protein
MNYLAIKDLKAPKLVREKLAAYGTALVTNNGQPMALLVNLAEGESPERLVEAVRLARARLALSDLRQTSRRNGVATMTPAEIEGEIRAARNARRARQGQT